MRNNYSSIIVFLALLLFQSVQAQTTQKNLINYQGVARTAAGELMADESMNIGIALRFGSPMATTAYEETHTLSTDSNGVFSIQIGNGNVISGNYDLLPWGSLSSFVTVSVNGMEVGITEMTAVPYAIIAGNVQWETDGVKIVNKNWGGGTC